MTIKISINCDNAAFDPAADEVARILRELAKKLDGADLDEAPSRVYDANGNAVGTVEIWD